MIDIDAALWIEYGHRGASCRAPIALIETARDVNQDFKPVTVLCELAKMSHIPAYVVLYKLSDCSKNPADSREFDIESFRVKRAWPNPESLFRVYTPKQWAQLLLQIREQSAAEVDRMASREEMFGT